MVEPRRSPRSIAIVEDDAKLLISLRRNLRGAGFEVATFASAEEYLLRDFLNFPDLVLVDLRLPRMSGVELSLEMSRLGTNVPIIFMTGCGQQETARELEAIGSPDCLRKPFAAGMLRMAIDRGIESRSSR